MNDLQVGAIPSEFLRQASGDISEQQSFGNHTGEFEISTGLHFASLAGIEPFAFVAGRTWQRFGRLFVAFIFDSGISRGLAPLNAQRILPRSPTKRSPSPSSSPSPLRGRSCSSSSGRGGFRPPSYHVNFTGGMSPRAGKL